MKNDDESSSRPGEGGAPQLGADNDAAQGMVLNISNAAAAAPLRAKRFFIVPCYGKSVIENRGDGANCKIESDN